MSGAVRVGSFMIYAQIIPARMPSGKALPSQSAHSLPLPPRIDREGLGPLPGSNDCCASHAIARARRADERVDCLGHGLKRPHHFTAPSPAYMPRRPPESGPVRA